MTPSDPLIKGYACDKDTHEEHPIRFMTPEEIKERDALNYANTASALRQRVVAELARANGFIKTST